MYELSLCNFFLNFIVETAQEPPQRAAQIAPGARRRALANRNVRARQRVAEDEEEYEEVQEERAAVEVPEGTKVGTKKLAKLQAKAEKKALREVKSKLFHYLIKIKYGPNNFI